MRACLIACLLLAACSGSSKTTNKKPVVDPARADVDTFCGPDATAKATSLDAFGPAIGPKLREGGELKKVLFEVRDGRIDLVEFRTRVQEITKKSGISSCPALDRLTSPK